MRKGSPAVPPNPISNSNTITASASKFAPGISAKTGKPKKNVRFAPDGELEKIKTIERAIYDDDDDEGSVRVLFLFHLAYV
jgi:protein phosphatase 1 regulatory subunit 10